MDGENARDADTCPETSIYADQDSRAKPQKGERPMSITITAIKDKVRQPVRCKVFNFSGGEVQARIEVEDLIDISTPRGVDWQGEPVPGKFAHAEILAHIRSSDDLMAVLLATDALHREGVPYTDLICPYFPYARQDRVCHPGEAYSLDIVTDLLHRAMFHSIEVWDPHSDVLRSLLPKKARIVEAADFVAKIKLERTPIIVAPDQGARVRAALAAERIEAPLVQAKKIRSPVDGSITGTEVMCDFMGDQDFLMVDDICDGGRTFIELAKVLRKKTSGKIYLYVTHGIFSNGFADLSQHISHIFTPNPFETQLSNEFITVLK